MPFDVIRTGVRKSLFGLIAGFLAAGFAASLLGIVVPFGKRPAFDAFFYINLFKIVVGFYCIAFSLYAYYGPIFYRYGYGQRLLPPKDIPIVVIIVYFSLGGLVLMTGLRAITLDPALYLFARVLAFSGFFGVATGFGVYTYLRAAERADDD